MSAIVITFVLVPVATSFLFAVALGRVAGRSDERMDRMRPELYRRAGGAALESITFARPAESRAGGQGLTESAA